MDDETTPEEKVKVAVIARGEPAELEELAGILEAAGVPHDIVAPPGSPGLFLVTPPEAALAANEAIADHRDQELPEEHRAANLGVVDLDAEEAVCPACGAPFATAAVTECPDCGLNLGG